MKTGNDLQQEIRDSVKGGGYVMIIQALRKPKFVAAISNHFEAEIEDLKFPAMHSTFDYVQ